MSWTDEQIQSLRAAQDTDRVLATVMFTDIVDSTVVLRAWRPRSGVASSIGTTRQRRRSGSLARPARQAHR